MKIIFLSNLNPLMFNIPTVVCCTMLGTVEVWGCVAFIFAGGDYSDLYVGLFRDSLETCVKLSITTWSHNQNS